MSNTTVKIEDCHRFHVAQIGGGVFMIRDEVYGDRMIRTFIHPQLASVHAAELNADSLSISLAIKSHDTVAEGYDPQPDYDTEGPTAPVYDHCAHCASIWPAWLIKKDSAVANYLCPLCFSN